MLALGFFAMLAVSFSKNMPSASQTKKVLVIDDDQSLTGSLQRKFQKLGFQTEAAYDGLEALNLMNKEHFDGILLDLKMPKKDGFDVLKEKETTLNSGTPAFVLTSLDEDKCALARKLGARETFDKVRMSPTEVAAVVGKELTTA